MSDYANESIYGYDVRDPSESEIEWFAIHPETPAMATEDGRIIVNPHIDLTQEQRRGLLMNEASRLYMKENNIVPEFDITPEQQKSFAGGPYENNPSAMKQTIIGRILSNDRSAGNITPHQLFNAGKIHYELRRRNK
jgi:hypothetical protein